ncbi:hypothetical protein A176_005615 [Myxococcus hansupus]|uniref:Uncharacterized protein n=1 Tax=Pseudomyxococcus hansupus TaxID=1297742 RepID=A0A0H4X485_9BACT|nr:hypothetical protein [Myxococcus hansupus]AKQ68703.1 hypothetical protein A176_005615 [Myxococcus hansupus]
MRGIAFAVLGLLLGGTAAAQPAPSREPPRHAPAVPEKPHPTGEPPRARDTLSAEDREVVDHLELLEGLDAAEALDLLLELTRDD